MKVLIVLSLAALSQAMILCPPNACDVVRCKSVTAELCDGRFSTKGGYCGCCPVCVAQLGEGDNCISSMLLGAPITAECGENLYCNPKTVKCEASPTAPKTGACALEKAEKQARLDESVRNGTPLRGLHLPDCEEDGTYSKKQCIEASCRCVSAEGDFIFDYGAPVWESKDMDCNCARDQQEYMELGIIGKMFRCSANGNYDKVRCSGSVCFCANKNGDMLTGSQSVPIGKQDSLQC